MSISRGFTAEELQALAPWRLPEIGAAERANVKVEELEVAEAPPSMTAEEIEAIQKQAYEEAAEQGYGEGRQKGYEEGNKKGYEEGYQKGHEEGTRKGYQEGHAEGRGAGEAELRELRLEQGQRLQQLLTALDQPLSQLDEQVEHELVLLAVAIAKQVIRRELKTDPGQIVATVKSAAAALPSAARGVVLHLHPDDGELVKAALSLADGGAQWKIVEDPLITRGGCRVASESSTVDATVEKRLAQAIAKVLGDEREHSA